MNDTELQDTLKRRFTEAFEQTQGGFDATHDFAMFLDERARKETREGFNRVERRLEQMDERFDRLEKLITSSRD